ncbi:MAG: hypothetical protein SX243_19810 [Acidobacteriota bacterium]|nr:hypothetical protein [Acidobacteriota bacterium]
MKLARDLREFVELLNSARVDYVLVGGYAVAFHGYPRYTGDIDLLIRPTIENGARLVAALEDFGFGSLEIKPETFLELETVVQLGYPPNRVDLLTSITGVDFEAVWSTRVKAQLDELSVPIIGREALLTNKRASGRAQDLADLENLEAVSKRSP